MDTLVCIGEQYGPWITAGAILFSAAVAVGVMIYNAKIARRRATVDLVMHMRQNSSLLASRKVVVGLQDKKVQISEYALLKNTDSPESHAVLEVLNINEFIAVGIREDAFDERTYKRLSRSRFIRDWDTLETYVYEFRKSRGVSTLFCEAEWLAKKWKDNL